MTKVEILWPAMRVHKAGCADVKKAMREGRDSGTRGSVQHVEPVSGPSLAAVLAAEAAALNADFGEDTWQPYDFSVAPCLKGVA